MDDVTIINYFGLFSLAFVALLLIIVSAVKNNLKENGIETKAIILRWTPDKIQRGSYIEEQPTGRLTVKFQTKDGKEIIGRPITSVYNPYHRVDIPIRIIYNPKNPKEFMVKE